MGVLELISKGYVFFDGAMGTQLQAHGLKSGEVPESWNITKPEIITQIHRNYYESGANIATANTFGANPLKIENVEEIVCAAIANAKKAMYNDNHFVALDIGPTGKLLKPLGDLDFEDAINAFAVTVKAGTKAGADLILIETMSDPYEMKAAVIAAKENSNLPIFTTFVLDENGKTVTGCDVCAMVAMLEGLGVDALGVNCSLGAEQLKQFIPLLVESSSLPVIVNPNAGMPVISDGKTYYKQNSMAFADNMCEIANMGARILGGCCGTTPDHIKAVTSALKDSFPKEITKKYDTVVSSYSHACYFNNKVVLIGERINPTGKPKLKAALCENDINYLIKEAIGQEEKGANMLDVNVGLPEIDEETVLCQAVKEIQAITTLPLQIDTSNPKALESALRIYNGKALVNSVNGKKESMEAVFPIVKKYGGAIIALTLDENGIPNTARERADIAKKIIETAKKYGIDKKDIIVDPLCLTVSSDKTAPSVTLEAVEIIKRELGVKTSLGISNVSFGLPSRDIVNAVFFAHALEKGLDAVIMNPYSDSMQNVYYAHNALLGIDENCQEYIAYASKSEPQKATVAVQDLTLERAIIKGMKKEAGAIAKSLLTIKQPLDIINEHIIPALDTVGAEYEKGIVFLPQLLMSAETATVAFDVIKEQFTGDASSSNGEIILATVKGDIHDIGKNIVKVILQNYGFTVYDLGKDVPAEKIVRVAKEKNIKLVGLSALMTTTVVSMEEAIKLLNKELPSTKIVVGGAVLTPEYAEMIGADKYCKDAMETVRYAQELFK
ncbi:MAG: homocysteine S-methyltransferase family protein [Clostridia bacterium]|nr:homocysteine S-methyltransferase family protein [Clostridia bacterium]